ncbi:MAG: ATP-binding protein [Armatimonadetes bacterium]|nr:ATP-binding protein [Armatimonadota bacterium]
MDSEQLRQLINRGESLDVEFKREISDAHDLAGEIVAFANGEGGTLLVGVDDSGIICGLSNPNETERRLMGVCRESCRPAVEATPVAVELEGETVVALTISKGLDKPYSTSTDHYTMFAWGQPSGGRPRNSSTGCSKGRASFITTRSQYPAPPRTIFAWSKWRSI